MDNKRRYLNCRMSRNDLREERHDKRTARAEGKAGIDSALAASASCWDGDDIAHEADVWEARGVL